VVACWCQDESARIGRLQGLRLAASRGTRADLGRRADAYREKERMTRQVAIELIVLGVVLGDAVRLRWQRRRDQLPSPAVAGLDSPVQELVSPSGRFKAVAFRRDGGAYRVEVFQLVHGEGDERLWRRVAGPSFADNASLARVLEDGLREASGGSVPG
jgi:hypothetical protein